MGWYYDIYILTLGFWRILSPNWQFCNISPRKMGVQTIDMGDAIITHTNLTNINRISSSKRSTGLTVSRHKEEVGYRPGEQWYWSVSNICWLAWFFIHIATNWIYSFGINYFNDGPLRWRNIYREKLYLTLRPWFSMRFPFNPMNSDMFGSPVGYRLCPPVPSQDLLANQMEEARNPSHLLPKGTSDLSASWISAKTTTKVWEWSNKWFEH